MLLSYGKKRKKNWIGFILFAKSIGILLEYYVQKRLFEKDKVSEKGGGHTHKQKNKGD